MDSFDSFKHALKTFLALVKKLYILNKFELMTFYHVQGPKSGNLAINKNRFKQANGSVS